MEEARSRTRQVSQVRYVLFFGVDGKNKDFEGRAVVSFFWRGRNGAEHPLFLDFHQGSVQSLTMNGSTLSDDERARLYDGSRISLPESHLVRGTNRIEIAFTHPYSRNGTGLHRFEDPEDKKVYLYSQAQPFDANRIFPCFDQPDLKAVYELTVEAPEDWVVIANAAEREVVNFDHKASWQFPPTAAFSTYLFALHAGPYEAWKAEADGIPLRLFARGSIKPKDDANGWAKTWLEITRAGLKFFGERFGVPYPFGKYDQIIVPEFASGAMENVAAVTFSEDFVFRSRPTAAELRERADVILHEAAHMWFGNLVTMRWWDGLWLNESFATFASSWALESLASPSAEDPAIRSAPWAATLRENAGRELFNEKLWAYVEDGSRNTHPIEMDVPDTRFSEAIFDGITYSKGAAIIKQLVALVDEDDFIEGLRRYFDAFAYRSATTSQFLRAIEEAAGVPLGDWRKQWLQSPGMNRIEAQWSCDPETRKLDSLNILQWNGPQSSTLRRRRTQVALLYSDGQFKKDPKKKRDSTDWVRVTGNTTEVKSLVGYPCPDFVFTNWQDHDYALATLDDQSLAYLKKNLGRIRSPLLRSQIWGSLWHSVLWGKTSPAEFSEWFWTHGVNEKDPQILGSLLGRMASHSPAYGSVIRWLPDAGSREELLKRLDRLARRELSRTAAGSDLQRQWWEIALLTTRDPQWIEALLDRRSGAKFNGMPVDQDRRWELLRAWAGLPGHDSATLGKRLEDELARDPSDEGRKQALAVEATVARVESKQAALAKALSGRLNAAELSALASGWQLTGHDSLIAPLTDQSLAGILEASTKRPHEEAALVASGFVPLACESSSQAKLSQFVGTHGNKLPPGVIQELNRGLDEEERCVRLRTQSTSSSTTGQ